MTLHCRLDNADSSVAGHAGWLLDQDTQAVAKGSFRQQLDRIRKLALGQYGSPSQRLMRTLNIGLAALLITTTIMVFTMLRISEQINYLRTDLRTVLPETTDPRFSHDLNIYTNPLKAKSDKLVTGLGVYNIRREIAVAVTNGGRKPVVLYNIRLIRNTYRKDYPFSSEKSSGDEKANDEDFTLLNSGESKIISVQDDVSVTLKPEIAEEIAKRDPEGSTPDPSFVMLQQRVHVQFGIITPTGLEFACLGPFLDSWGMNKETHGTSTYLKPLSNMTLQLLLQNNPAGPRVVADCQEMYNEGPDAGQD